MDAISIALEIGSKKSFASALDWIGWSRSGKDEASALQALLDYAPRYTQVLQQANIEFPLPSAILDFTVVERHPGNATTDYGAPGAFLEADLPALQGAELARWQGILQACWGTFDRAVGLAQGKALRSGPRGGGRQLNQMVSHVFEAELAYLERLGWKYRGAGEGAAGGELERLQGEILLALDAALSGALPARGPRGGLRWTPRHYLRRSAWHLLDHAWEIEDRLA